MQLHKWEHKTLRYVEIEPYIRHNERHVRRFNLQQWCERADQWCRMLLPGNWHINAKSDTSTPVEDSECVISKRRLHLLNNLPECIVVRKEKYGVSYYGGGSTEEIGMVAIQILKERKNEGYYYELDRKQVDIPAPTHSPEDFPNNETLADASKQQWNNYNRQVSVSREEEDFRQRFKLAMNDYFVATRLLESRNDYEYEGFEIEEVISL